MNKETEWAYDFAVDKSCIDSGGSRHMTDLIQDGALAVIRYQIEYSEDSDLMERILQEYLEEVAWIPYDMAQRRSVCQEAFERLDLYSKN